ncbi:competence type IV pilus assembly protein ComGB [Lysinibacillus pakistanensis]|uniref:Competence type IV pilus assembly protein ComGB n=1 Tax=Lysinibacillus pakistanensis TaxID=759811 RepID=A0AAX3WT48_9BACI|nr:competence type IV pilus assembly protein ComGB [Lysinibacillus pakistanensis]MDM5234357.1 competence type IV pilus assembly protein ComGB [Lysinibacillus pakistanensis]WHY44946.1 competence type IV pilus assembly protein ComGB [Lysinibacillus pakistanensis]WHY49953.1 competence type IV pilus assembly protein ComGB [Lysinibacillus pakistanensis]
MQLRKYTDKMLVEYKKATKWRVKEQAHFFSRLSVLMQEGYLFPQAISILLPHHIEAHEEIQQRIDEKLRQGIGVTGILETLRLARHHLVAIAVAENNGHMIEALKGVAKQMAVSEATKKKLLRLLLYPVVLIVFLLLLFFVFRTVFFPNIEKMISSRTPSNDQTMIGLSKMFLHFPDALVLLGIASIGSILFFQLYLKRQSMARQLTIISKIPFVQIYVRLSLTRQFAAYLGSLLESGFSLQASLQILEEQRLQPLLQHLARCLKERVVFGDTLTQAVQLTAVWQRDFSIFVEHGEKSGYLGKELLLYSELLTDKQEQLLHRILAFVQPTFFIIIAICIVAAYVSLLLPIYHMIELV